MHTSKLRIERQQQQQERYPQAYNTTMNKSSDRSRPPKKAQAVIEATSQQTRFDPSTSTTPSSFAPSAHNPARELDIHDINLSIISNGSNSKVILQDAHLKLLPGVKYLLHGQNGTGKSTILKAINDKIIPGVPGNVVISLLQQREGDDEESDIEAGTAAFKSDNEQRSALELVLQSDRARMTALKRRDILQSALEDTSDPNAPAKALRQIKHEDYLRHLELAQKEAELRSGARGSKARKALKVAEGEVQESLFRLQIQQDDSVAEESDEAVQLLAQIEADLEAMSSDTAHLRAEELLLGLGFTRKTLSKPLQTLSGGWKMRAHLASALFVPCHILLLDEPSSFLDFASLLWLEDYLASSFSSRGTGTTLMLVSHDRAFADNITDEVLILRDLKIEYFAGNLSAYYTERKKLQRRYTKLKESQDKKVQHIEKTIQNNLKSAKKSGDDKKLKQVASRSKKLDERIGLEISSKGGRFKLNRDLGGYHLNKRAEITIPKDDNIVKLKIPSTPEALRFPGPLIGCEGLSFKYYVEGSRKTKVYATPIFEDVNLSFRLGDRIGFVGLNGAGKSTLIACLVGSSSSHSSTSSVSTDSTSIEELGKISGTITRHPGAIVAYYSQEAVNHLPSEMTALQYLSLQSEQESRSALAALGLTGRTVSDVKIGDLSGGQRVRVALSKILFPVTPHVLVLDEVTTHLDADTVQVLSEQLRKFKGTLILVSHDRWFMNAVLGEKNRSEGDDVDDGSEEDSEDSDDGLDGSGLKGEEMVFWLDKGKVKRLRGGVDEFEDKVRKRAEKARKQMR